MAEKHFHSPQARVLNNLANLTSMCNNDFVELAWEDGRILTKPHSRVAQKTPSTFTSSNHSDSRGKSTEGNTSNENTERLETVSLSSFYGSRNLLQPDNSPKNMGSTLGYSHNLPQEAHSHLYHHGLSSLSVHNKSRMYDKNHLIGTYGMAIVGSTNPGAQNRSSVILKVPESTTRPMSSHQQGQQTPVSFLTSGPSPSITPYSGEHGLSNSQMLKESEARNMNFAYFFRQRSRSVRPGSSENFPTIDKENKKSSLAAECKTTIDASAMPVSRGSDDLTGFQEKHDVVSNRKIKPAYLNNVEEQAVPDEQSEAAGLLDSLRVEKSSDQALYPFSTQGATAEEKTANHEQRDEVPVASSSFCSRGASNNPACIFKGGYEESETAYASEHDTEETDDVAIATVPEREAVGTKRKRSAVHNLSERKRRDKINKKMQALQELLPNCNKKVDKASVLDETIDYLKTLQLQLQIMTSGTRFFTPPMMLPAAMQQLYTPHSNQLPAMGIGMGMRMGNGIGPSTSQLPTAPIPGGTLSFGNGNGGFQMLGFQPMPGLPFLPFFGQPSMPVVGTNISTLTSTTPYPVSDPLSRSKEADNSSEPGSLKS